MKPIRANINAALNLCGVVSRLPASTASGSLSESDIGNLLARRGVSMTIAGVPGGVNRVTSEITCPGWGWGGKVPNRSVV